MLAATLPMLVLPPAGIWLTTRHGWRANFTGGMALLALGLALLALAAFLAAGPGWALAAMTLGAAGAVRCNSKVSGALVAMAPPDRAGTATPLATDMRQGGLAIGSAPLGPGGGGGFAE